jgi:hypothetical protein
MQSLHIVVYAGDGIGCHCNMCRSGVTVAAETSCLTTAAQVKEVTTERPTGAGPRALDTSDAFQRRRA